MDVNGSIAIHISPAFLLLPPGKHCSSVDGSQHADAGEVDYAFNIAWEMAVDGDGNVITAGYEDFWNENVAGKRQRSSVVSYDNKGREQWVKMNPEAPPGRGPQPDVAVTIKYKQKHFRDEDQREE